LVDIRFKMCVFGEGGVGKTTLINRYISGNFKENYQMTIGVAFRSKVLKVNDLEVYLQIWDFAGENRFKFLLPNYVAGASGGIFMYDITRFHSISHVDEWMDVLKKGFKTEKVNIPLVLVGGKADLEEKRSVKINDALDIGKAHGISQVYECSSKTGHNIDEIFNSITIEMLKRAHLH